MPQVPDEGPIEDLPPAGTDPPLHNRVRPLDKNITAMAHPDALQALIAGQIAAAYTSPPFQFQAVEQGRASW